ncbi:MAG TPA: carboxypeptidase regulatory-like domain-containing protein [Bryobacteraceae bacterium]|nr:carboxypeptidase regulatory-like domain-containing protein [Bryobacteraceae bacterium]
MLAVRSATRFVTRFLCVAVCCALLLSTAARAQVLSGTLAGTVTDQTGAVVPGATITATDTETGREYKAASDQSGNFTFADLPNSTYRVVVQQPGFAKFEVAQVVISVSQTTALPVKLEVATTGTEIVVQAAQSAVQTESAELKNTVDRAQLDSIPMPTRNPLDLVKTFAGVLTPNNGAGTAGDAFVNGLRGNTTNITQDGINVQDNFVKTSAFFALSAPVADSIGEFNMTVGGVGADAGFGSAQVSMITQRGTNAVHGEAYWYQRTSFLNANTWFNNLSGIATPFQLQNRLGATIGGPVWIPKIYHGKNRTFFFFAYEAYREPRSQPRTRTVMTTSAEQGLFTYTPTTGGGPVTVNLLNVGTIGNTGIKPAVNSAIMGIYTKYVPQSGYTDAGCGSGDGANFRCIALNLGGVNNQTRYTTRIDQQLGSKHSIEFVFNESLYNTAPDFLNSNEPAFPGAPWSGGQVSTRQVFVWALQSVWATKTNEFRVGFQRAPVDFAYGNTFGETGGNQINYQTITSPIMTSTNFPQGRNTPARQFIDNFAWVKGNHQLRFGGEYRWLVAYSYLDNAVYPRISLQSNAANPDGLSTATLPGISAAELAVAQAEFHNITGLLGTVQAGYNHTSPTSGYVNGVQEQYTPVQQNMAGYAQDSWKMKRNLTIQYGTRWEYQGPYDARNGLVLLPQNNVKDLYGPTPIGALFQPGVTNGATDVQLTLQGGSNGKPVTNRQLHNFAPFIGIAWAPGSDNKWSIRANFSTHYVQDGFTFWTPATTGNTGLFSLLSNATPTGVFSSSSVPLPTPTTNGSFPVSQLSNWISSGGSAALTAYDPNLKVPYVLEWSLGVQRELVKHITLETRYVGNHAVKQYRTYSINEQSWNTTGLLQEFLHAQNNLNIDIANKVSGSFANNGFAGQVPTPILDKIFAGLAASSGYGSSGFITNLNQNNIYPMYNTIRTSATYRPNVLGTNGNNPTNFPLNFFVANPWATNANYVGNAGWSYYDGLEVEVKKVYGSGFFMQANYTFSKVLADTQFGESQTETQNYQSLANTRLDKFRADFDVRHSFGVTYGYPLPVGHGRHYLGSAPRWVDAVVGGWNVYGFTHWQSGAPLTISSNRQTNSSGLFSTPVLENMTAAQLQSHIGVYRTGYGPYWLDPSLSLDTAKGLTSTANFCTAGQTTPCWAEPAPGQLGQLPYLGFSGPRFFDQDASIVKNIQIKEALRFEMRLEAYDLFNNANFNGAQLSLDGTTFGQLTSTQDTARGGGVTSRIVQWAVRLHF